MDEPDTIAVIGGGPSAKHLLIALGHAAAHARLDARRLRVRVYEEGASCGSGLAWHPEQVAAVHHSSLPVAVNRAAEGVEEMRRFARVCAFLREYGADVAVECGRRVLSVAREGFLWRVACDDGRGALARHVVLAIGHGAFGSRRPPGVDCIAPWPFGRLADAVARLDGPADVLVLGSYLSAVDVVTGLAQRFRMADPQAPAQRMPRLHLVSPSGELPKVWGRDPGVFDRQSAIRAALGSVAGTGLPEGFGLDAFARVVLHAAGAPAAPGADAVPALAAVLESLCEGDARERLARDLAEVTLHPDAPAPELSPPWQRALFGCLPLLSEAFHRFPPADRLAFLPLRARYYKAAMAMSLADARCLRALFARGLLRVLRGGASVPQPHADGGWELNPALDAARRRYALVVDAAGPDTRLAHTPSALLRGLHQAGLISPVLVPGPNGAAVELGGVRVDPFTCAAVPADGGEAEAPAGLFAMGPLVVGTFPDAQSIGHIARDAERIVRHLCRAPSSLSTA